MRALELAVGGASLPLILTALVQAIEEAADRSIKASVLLLDKDGKRLRHGAAPSLPASYNEAIDGIEIGPGVGACGTAAYLQNTVLASDIATDERWAAFRELALSHGLGACWSTPIRSSRGQLLGTFALYYPYPTEPAPLEVEAVSLLSNTAAIVIERHIETQERERAELALQKLGAQLGLITDAIPALISYITPDYRYRLVNRYYDEWFSSREAVIGQTMREVLGQSAWDKVEPWMKRAQGGQPVEYESRLTYKDGRVRWVNARYTPDIDDAGLVRGVVALVTDIDQRKRMAERQAFMNRLMQATQPLSDPAEVTMRTAQLLAEFLNADRCAYARIELDPQEVFVITGDYTRDVPSIVGRWPVRSFGQECERLMRCNLPFVVHDTEKDPRISSADMLAYRATTIRSVICVPLHKDGQLTASMAVHQASPRVWSTEEIELVQSVVANCWESLERSRAIQRLSDSEMRYRTLFESMDEGFILGEVIFDEAGRPIDICYLESNPAAIRITGVDYRGKRLSELTPAYEPYWLEVWGRVACTGVGERDQRYTTPLGKWFDFYVYPIGRKVAIVFQDITAQRATAQALSQSATRHAFMVDMGDSLRDVIDTHEIKDIAARLLGQQLGVDSAFYVQYDEGHQLAIVHAEFKARHDQPSLVGNYRMRDFAVSHDILRRGQPLLLNDILSHPGLSEEEQAQYRLLGMRALLCVSLVKQGKLVGGLVVAQVGARQWGESDVALVQETAERTWAALERANAERALRDADRRKDEFLATLAHELRNPLAPIRNGLQIARKTGPSNPVLRDTVDMMDRQLSHLVRLVDDLLDVGRITSGKLDLRRAPLSLVKVLENSIDLTRVAIETQHQQVRIENAEHATADLTVHGDFDRLTQVFVNLLSNAAKYSSKPGTITIRISHDSDMATVQVIDQGIGIAAKDLPFVFELFSQVRDDQGHAAEGLGIGLSLVRSLLTLHGGSVDAQSAGHHHGSTFTVRIPLAKAPAHEVMPEGPQETGTPQVAKRILIADDNRDAASSLALLLDMHGHQVVTAHDGVEAVDLAQTFLPDIVFLDLGMPLLDGFGAARQLRQIEATQRVVLVALTGWGQADDRKKTEQAGFDHHLVKPIELDSLDHLLAIAFTR